MHPRVLNFYYSKSRNKFQMAAYFIHILAYLDIWLLQFFESKLMLNSKLGFKAQFKKIHLAIPLN